jgi:hypothetical protein
MEDEPAPSLLLSWRARHANRLDRWVMGPDRRTRDARLRRLPKMIFGPCGQDAINPGRHWL